ncbi:Flp pilus assembly protein CpaB [Arthrobacter pityocampae]|uniref:Flp pilus assembly protein CpaB n=1 Tax=Arthrobacter pityocampae TaxID=547334 RepID=A0A2S5J2B2_9MICC|nr:Flp pilus assembly protein CpaB [Arthrobacter pityocampae]PPB50931.1 Flp pilus assembly protein CpaB [Arthrobacter pityocampae]
MQTVRRPPGAPLRRRLHRTVHRRRRLLACLFLCAAAGVAVEAIVEDHPTTAVVSAAHDLAVGTVLTQADVSVVRVPDQAVAAGTLRRVDEVVGRQLATPLPEGFPFSATAFVGDGLLTGMEHGTVAVPLRPADPATVQLLTPGQRVDVILSAGDGYDVPGDATVLARSVAVLWTAPDAGGGTWPGAGDDDGLVVVAAGPEDAAALAGASSAGDVHLVLTSGS